MNTCIEKAKAAIEAEENGDFSKAAILWGEAAQLAGTASERRMYAETATNTHLRARKIAGQAVTAQDAPLNTTDPARPYTAKQRTRWGKAKTRIIKCANFIHGELSDPDLGNDARAKLEDARALLIDATNRIMEAING